MPGIRVHANQNGLPTVAPKTLQACVDLCRREAERILREIGKRLLVELDDFEAALFERKPKRVAHGESFGDRHMLGPGKAILQEVGDPTGAIDEQCRDDWRFVQLTD
ncbi:MAG: hypothetical protein JWN27_4605, partial [Candidatus Eremiobacteraeota bacterium]|nr:hypothetical protein [Candidatus Eremiobacteraeota bacterium]